MSLTVTVSYLPTRRLYRIPHDIERVKMYVTGTEKADFRYSGNANGSVRKSVIDKGDALPEVYKCAPEHQTPLNSYWQWVWRWMNDDLDAAHFCTLFGNTLAWCNGTGNGEGRNYVLGKDLDLDKDIAFDQPRLCGGAIVEAQDETDTLVYLRSLISSRPLTGEPFDDAQRILEDRALWYWGTSVNPSGEINLITRLGVDGERYPVRIPFITRLPVVLRKDELHKVDDFILNPGWLSA